MQTRRELNLKPRFSRDLKSFPRDDLAMLWEKIDRLVEDPLPDGKLKKKLEAKNDLYRLRVGDHRVLYTFGDAWIRLLAIVPRDERTYGAGLAGVQADAPQAMPRVPEDEDAALEEALRREDKGFQFDPHARTPRRPALPRRIDEGFLDGLQIPAEHRVSLLQHSSEEQLLDAPVPKEVLQRVLDALYPTTLTPVLAEPDLVARSTDDLIRWREGELLGFLLKLDAEQERLTRWALKGPTMVKGGAGTGKSTVALHRVRAVLTRRGAGAAETCLFTTYTQALLRASEQLLDQLLDPPTRARVRVVTCDTLAREVVGATRAVGEVATGPRVRELFREARAEAGGAAAASVEAKLQARALARIPDDYLLDEFTWIIEGRDLTSLESYQTASRAGRGVVLGEKLRAAVWSIYQRFKQRIARAKLETWAGLRREAAELLRNGRVTTRWDHVMVDEAQDLSPTALAMLAELARTPDGLFFAADTKQSLYARGFTFASAHPRLQFKGRTALLTRNWRSTEQIDRAAFGLLIAEEGESLESSVSPHVGPMPVLARGMDPAHEGRWIARWVRQMASHLHLGTDAAAVLVPDKDAGEAIARAVTAEGVSATWYKASKLDLRARTVKVLTLHAAKGLEFPMVALAGLRPGAWPRRESYDTDGEYDEALRLHRRLLYVGMTRAMRGLMVLQPKGWDDPALAALDAARWNVVEA